jgi:hypothetical protein
MYREQQKDCEDPLCEMPCHAAVSSCVAVAAVAVLHGLSSRDFGGHENFLIF